jgi:hypothetical protein
MSDTRIMTDEVASRLEILALFARYCHAVDTLDWTLFEDVFTADVVADYSTVGEYVEDDTVIAGLENLVAWFEKSMSPVGSGLTHFMTNHLINITGDEGTAVVHNHVLNVGMGGVYHTRVRRTDQGWRIYDLRFEVRYFEEVAQRMNGHMVDSDGRLV